MEIPSKVNERAGQLYAYRINESAVILGTRDNETFNAPIGIKPVADGEYKCLTINTNETETIILNIRVKGMHILLDAYFVFYT